MAELTAKQQQQIVSLGNELSDAKIAKKLGLDQSAVKAFRRQQQQAGRQKRERVFKIIMLATPVLFFLIFELILRAGNYGGNLALFTPAELVPGYLQINDNVGRRYFSSIGVTPEASKDLMRAVKAPNSYRIFVLGESTTAGYPYMYNGSMSKMLYQRLRDYFPEREIEVVNLAMPAINSFALLDLTEEALAQQPDALIIYCGHNEFYGALGVASTESLGRWRGMINLYLDLQQLKIMLFLRDQLAALKKMLSPASPGQGKTHTTLMEQMVGDEQIEYGGEKYNRARDFFKANLTEIINAGKEKGVDVLLANLVSNERDLAPFETMYDPATDRPAFERELQRGQKLAAAGNTREALALYDSLEQIDATPAVLHFLKGRGLEASGRFEEARSAYVKARDLDGLRFRASADFNAAIQEVAQATGAVLVDMHAAFTQASPKGLIGKNLMLEHVHPNLEGYFIMGRELCEAMHAHGMIETIWDARRSRPDSVYWQERGVTALDEEVAAIRLDVLMNNWPFTPKERSIPFRYQPKNYLQKLAYAMWQREESWEKVHVLLAEDYEKTGQYELAIKEYEALILQTPHNSSPYIRAGLLYAHVQDFDRAYDRLLKSIALEPSAEACKVVGAILVSRRQPDKGVPYLQKALQLAPNDGQTLYNLAGAYMMLGQTENARAVIAQLEKLSPGNAKIEQLKQQLIALTIQ